MGGPSASLAAAAADDDDELDEVQVTGTRIQTPNATSSNPITSITGEEMRQLGIVNVADALNTLVPQNVSTYTPAMVGDDQAGFGGGGMDRLDRGSFFIGQTIANLRGMDPAFGSRTLTMIDGRRVVSSSNQADVVDMNIIPSNLLQRMDVVTGGASATYGSGAIAGVVNLVLNNRMSGVKLDMDYGVNEAGDGSSPHIAISGGMPLLDGRAHALIGLEWQNQAAIRDCAAARDWCAESRLMFGNNSLTGTDPRGVANPLPGFEGLPARFQMANVRYSQFSPNATVYHNSTNNTVGYRFSADGTNVEEYAYGYRGGTGGNVMNGDGPLVTTGQTLRASNERKTVFTNFEYNITERTTGYLQTNFARTDGLNKNRYTTGTYCTRFDVAGTRGTNAPAQAVWTFGTTFGSLIDGTPYAPARTSQFNNATTGQTDRLTPAVITFLGLDSLNGIAGSPNLGGVTSYISGGPNPYSFNGGARTPGIAFPFWVPYELSPGGPPNFAFNGNAVGRWVRVRFNNYNNATRVTPPTTTNFATGFQNDFWILDTITLTNAFDIGTATVLPALGRNSYAFLNQLSPEALYQVQNAFNNSPTAGGGPGLDTLYGPFTPCGNFTALRKVWNPQVQQWTSNRSETMRVVAGIKGRFGRDWRWEGYYQWGQTESLQRQNDVATNLRLSFAMDAVIDDRVGSPTYGQPICRVVRDGSPILDYQGRPLSNPESLANLADDCRPINIFGSTFANNDVFPGFDAAATQAEAIEYAFVESISKGTNSLHTLSLTTSGTLWDGFGAGPLTGAFGVEMREDEVDNAGTDGDFYARADLARTWADAFGGSTRVIEGFTELNLPLVSGQPGINLWSVNASVRYSQYRNKGGAGTTGETATQDTTNWKFSTLFEPFDWVRLRLTRSRDLRAAGYRDLFLYQPSIPDQFDIRNPWRDRTAYSTENQQERYGQVRVGNNELKPEVSDTLTLGIVLSPGGWAQGMRLSADYYDIKVKRGIITPFTAANPVNACFEQSGNRPPQYIDGELVDPGVRDLFDETLAPCKELAFAELNDLNGNPIPGTRNLEDIVYYNSARPANALPYQRRGMDLSLSYTFPLSRAFESLPGNMSLSVRGQRAMESSGTQVNSVAVLPAGYVCLGTFEATGGGGNCYIDIDQVGMIRSSVFVPGVQASPKWTGNFSATYLVGDFTTSLSARYIGGAFLDTSWGDSPDDANYINAQGQYLNGSVDNNWVKPYLNYSLNGSYNLQVANLKQFQVFGSINNLFDKSPPFTGGGISGASAQYHDTMGRSYRMGVRMTF